MNPLHEQNTSQTRGSRSRYGLTIVEVLTSIVVAMIGVFGVMILIPFAVQQAQSGLDSDAAVLTGRNAYSQFEIQGYRNPESWAIARPGGTITSYSPNQITDTDNDGSLDTADWPEVFSIDPLAITENIFSPSPTAAELNTAFSTTIFPYNQFDAGVAVYPAGPFPDASYPTGTGSATLYFRSVGLGVATGGLMGQAMARRLFRTADDLVFGEAADELLGPAQVYDQDVGALRRQSIGRLSWSAIVVPFKRDATTASTTRWSYKMYILVYKNRKTLVGDADGAMLTAMLNPALNAGAQSPVSNVFLETGVTDVESAVARDDWVMLINRGRNPVDDGTPPAGTTFLEKGFDRQIAFYRVINAADGNGATASSLTLDGPDFNFGDPSDTSASSVIRETYVVHLKDVVGVYERTFDPESESTWAF